MIEDESEKIEKIWDFGYFSEYYELAFDWILSR